MIDWAGGYSASWRAMLVDPATWADSAELGHLDSAGVQRSASQLRETGSAEMTLPEGATFGEGLVRIEMLATQGAERERVPVATLLMARTGADRSRGRVALTLEGRSVLAYAADERVLAGTYAPRGADGAAWAARMLSCCPCPIEVMGSFALADHVVFAAGTTRLEAAWALLDSAGWVAELAGDGTCRIRPLPTEPALDLGRANARLLTAEPAATSQLSKVPNRYMAALDGEVAVAVNEDAADESSHAARGRWVDAWDGSATPLGGEGLQAYAERMLRESAPVGTVRYSREWWPGVTVGSVVRGGMPSRGLDGLMRVTSQSLTCGAGVTVTETVEVLR